jgi:hypothetical protein
MARPAPFVSIALPVYNGERYLAEAIDSLVAQTFTDFELVIVDNASTDRTAAICESYVARDPRIRYFRNATNLGVYRNFNKAFELSSGRYFKWASADDLCHPELVAKCIQVLDGDPRVVAAYAKTRFIDAEGNPLPITDPGWHLVSDSPFERLRFVLVSGHYVNVFFGLIRKEALSQTRLFPLYPGGDCALLGELSLKGTLVELPEHLFFRRFHPAASSQNDDPEWQSAFHTGKIGKAQLPQWRVCVDHIRTILTSNLSVGEKVQGLGVMGKRMLHSRHFLLQELRNASRRRWHATFFKAVSD